MPILGQESDIFPDDLLSNHELLDHSDRKWYCVYTISRREKDLMRKLHAAQVPFYGPVIEKRYRSPQGRLRVSYMPLFPNYVFMFANADERYNAMTTNCVSKCTLVTEPDLLVRDLRQVFEIVRSGIGLTPEARLEPGNPVRVKTGPFAGYEGTVIRREGKTRLLLSVHFLEQGISIGMDEGLVEPL